MAQSPEQQTIYPSAGSVFAFTDEQLQAGMRHWEDLAGVDYGKSHRDVVIGDTGLYVRVDPTPGDSTITETVGVVSGDGHHPILSATTIGNTSAGQEEVSRKISIFHGDKPVSLLSRLHAERDQITAYDPSIGYVGVSTGTPVAELDVDKRRAIGKTVAQVLGLMSIVDLMLAGERDSPLFELLDCEPSFSAK